MSPSASPEVAFKRLDNGLPAVRRLYPNDAGADLVAVEDTIIPSGATARLATNIAIALPDDHYAVVGGRSGLNSAGILTHLGIIDPGFRGQILVTTTNLSGEPFAVRRGDRIAQLIVQPLVLPVYNEVGELPPRAAGEGGLGSRGGGG